MPNAAPLTAAGPAAILRRLAALPPPSLLSAGFAIVLLHGAYSLWLGVIWAPDSRSYAYWSGRLLESGFSYASLYPEAEVGFPAVFYALFASLLALLRLVFGDGWPTALVILNFAAHAGLGLIIVRLATRVCGSGVAGWAALILFLGCHDLLQWVNFVLSDATFVLLAFTIFALAARRILCVAKDWWAVAVLAVAGIFYRPTGIVLVPDLVWAFYLSRRRGQPVARGTMIGVGSAAAVCGLALFAWLVQDPGRWPFPALSGAWEIVAGGYAAGEVVRDRPETYHAPPAMLLDYATISLDRFLHFFAPGAAGYSVAHWWVSSAFLLPCYVLGGWLLMALSRGDTAFARPERNVFIAAAGAIAAYACFHALIQVDFDWRYRTPILPHLIVLAAGGTADLLRRATSA